MPFFGSFSQGIQILTQHKVLTSKASRRLPLGLVPMVAEYRSNELFPVGVPAPPPDPKPALTLPALDTSKNPSAMRCVCSNASVAGLLPSRICTDCSVALSICWLAWRGAVWQRERRNKGSGVCSDLEDEERDSPNMWRRRSTLLFFSLKTTGGSARVHKKLADIPR